MPHITRIYRKTQKQLRILIDTGATSRYIKKGIYENKEELPTYKRVYTDHGYSIIKYYHILTIFETKHLFYEISKIGAKIYAEKGIMGYNGKKEKLEYYDNEK